MISDYHHGSRGITEAHVALPVILKLGLGHHSRNPAAKPAHICLCSGRPERRGRLTTSAFGMGSFWCCCVLTADYDLRNQQVSTLSGADQRYL